MGFLSDLFGGGGDDGSKELRRQEEERQRRIREGTNAISRIFGGKVNDVTTEQEPYQVRDLTPMVPVAGSGKLLDSTPRYKTAYRPVTKTTSSVVPGQFGDDFFNNLEQEYNAYYMPQFDRQAMDAARANRIGLARSGNLSGSVGARMTGRLAEDTERERRRIIDEGVKYSSGQRKSVEDTRGRLINQLESGAGVENVAAQANAQANAMTAPPAFSPLGDLFKNYTAAVTNASAASGSPNFPGADEYRRNLLFNIPSASRSSGSASVVT